MAGRRTFQVRCANRILAEVIKDDLEEKGFLVEPPYEEIRRQSRHQHKRVRGEIVLIFSVPSGIKDDTPEMHIFEAYVDKIAFDRQCR